MHDLDLFYLFRALLMVFAGVYTILTTLSGLRNLRLMMSGSDPRKRLVQGYVSYQLLSAPLSVAVGELLQIAGLLAALLLVWRLHFWL